MILVFRSGLAVTSGRDDYLQSLQSSPAPGESKEVSLRAGSRSLSVPQSLQTDCAARCGREAESSSARREELRAKVEKQLETMRSNMGVSQWERG